tara:strand:+ start:69 stop:203 length:135 start_codon:yes stop_codon:yes gene_type:complete
MTTKNDVTGDPLKSKTNTQKYRDNWDLIFNKNKDVKKEKLKEVK